MTDMKIEYSNFHKCLVPAISSRTIITEDPVGAPAETLRNYARTAPIYQSDILDQLCQSIINGNMLRCDIT